MDANGANARQLSFDQPSATSPAWSPDGRWIAFVGASEDGDSQYRPWLVDTRSGKVSALGSIDLEVGSGHHFFESGRPSHPVDAVRRLVDWVERWVVNSAVPRLPAAEPRRADAEPPRALLEAG